jgi:hypothetical protein
MELDPMAKRKPDPERPFEKIRRLSRKRVAEVAHFVDFLESREREQHAWREVSRLSEPAFARVWDNAGDVQYDRILAHQEKWIQNQTVLGPDRTHGIYLHPSRKYWRQWRSCATSSRNLSYTAMRDNADLLVCIKRFGKREGGT